MNTLRNLLAPLALLACAGTAHALDITYDNDPNLRMPLKPVTEQQRQVDLALGNCLKANGGRMAPRCAALRDQSGQAEIAAKAGNEQAGSTAAAPASGTPTIEHGPIVPEGPVSGMPAPAK
ncbi:MAG TPA: hypothetical protein VH105_15350 [Burkholderiales bacterium]|jgi:hypothetical protein|nr:hypothetical protein [Burkholderiales bacterium]